MGNLILKDKSLYVCYACGSNKTRFGKTRYGNRYELWFLNKPTVLAICSNCYMNIFFQQRIHAKKWRYKAINFRGKRIYLKHNPRIGICSKCGKEGITHLHHSQYDESDPLRNTTELCASCHTKESWKLNQINGQILRKNGIRFQYIPPRDPKTGRFRGFS